MGHRTLKLYLAGSACLVSATLALNGCGDTSDDDPAGNSASGGVSQTGGAQTTGATPGSAGVTFTGGGPAAGGTGAGGAAGGATGGTGGSSDSNVGTLGQPCSPAGKLACAGHAQKLTVLCGGDGTWQPNETCGAEEFCDTRDVATTGTCMPVDPFCVERTPGEQACDGDSLLECGPDLVSTETVEECNEALCGALCPEPCPSEPFINCDPACGEVAGVCTSKSDCNSHDLPVIDLSFVAAETLLRLPPAFEACWCGLTATGSPGTLRLPADTTVMVADPWVLITDENPSSCLTGAPCVNMPVGEQGYVIPAAPINAPAANLRISFDHPACSTEQ